MSKKVGGQDPKGFVEALREIQQIIDEVSSREVDIDSLEKKLRRASTLILWCNERITAAEVVVEEIAVSLKDLEANLDEDDEDEDFDDDDEDFDEDDDDFGDDDE